MALPTVLVTGYRASIVATAFVGTAKYAPVNV